MARGGGSNPLLNPNAPLSGRALLHAAKALVHASTRGPMRELAHQIAVNQQQGQGAQQRTSGYFNQLGGYAHQGFQDVSQAASDLNNQLSGIGQGTQTALKGIGQSAQSSLGQYTPGLQGGPGVQGLAEEIARQQGLAAQSSGAFQAAGATQGANQRGLAGTNEGVYGLMGQERLGQVGQATALSNEPLNSKIAALRASEGDLLAKNEGALRQQEITNQITQQGLGLKQQSLAATVANDKARIQATIRGQDVSLTEAQARNRIATINSKLASQRLSETQRHNLATEKAAIQRGQRASGGGSGRAGSGGALTQNENNRQLSTLNKIQASIQAWQQGGMKDSKGNVVNPHPTNAQMRQVLSQNGYDPNLIQASLELLGWGFITPATARALHASGLRGGTFRRRPIRVAPPPKNRSISGSASVGGAVSG